MTPTTTARETRLVGPVAVARVTPIVVANLGTRLWTSSRRLVRDARGSDARIRARGEAASRVAVLCFGLVVATIRLFGRTGPTEQSENRRTHESVQDVRE